MDYKLKKGYGVACVDRFDLVAEDTCHLYIGSFHVGTIYLDEDEGLTIVGTNDYHAEEADLDG